MKNFILVFVFLLLVNIAVPVGYRRLYQNIENISPSPTPQTEDVPPVTTQDKVILYDEAVGTFIQVDLLDYIVGATACEMPALYEQEALKAQMIAVHSYYKYCRENPSQLEDGYIKVNSKDLKGYADKTRLMEFWGMNFYDYHAKFVRCANEVIGKVITYNGKTAITPYFAVSRSKTASSSDVWGQPLDYLVSVDSSFDGISDDFMQIKEFKVNELYTILKSTFPALRINQSKPEEWFGDIVYFDSGYAKYVTVAGDLVPGDQFRNALNLPSSCVMVFYEDGIFSVATKGYGHGVGMSQFGANQLSQQGYDYSRILSYYYPGTVLSDIV